MNELTRSFIKADIQDLLKRKERAQTKKKHIEVVIEGLNFKLKQKRGLLT